jgi:hypothetical protein
MSDFLGMERDAARIRTAIREGAAPDVLLLLGITFLERYKAIPLHRLESYARELVPAISVAARSCKPGALLPSELDLLSRACDLLGRYSVDVTAAWNLSYLRRLCDSSTTSIRMADQEPDRAGIRCLFVDYYHPTFGLPPRGRILILRASAFDLPPSAKEDIVTVHNPVRQIDDSFLEQAAVSVTVARNYLIRNHDLPRNIRFRIDYRIDAVNSQFTGDSLGVAFAVAATEAIAELQSMKLRFAVPHDVAFTGALHSDESVKMVDGQGLALKLERAWHSQLRAIALPNAHLVDAVRQIQEMRGESSNRQLDVVGVGRFDDIMRNPLLVSKTITPYWKWLGQRAWQAKRSLWVEIPVLTILLSILTFVILGLTIKTPVSIEYTNSGFRILNRFGFEIWSKDFPGAQLKDATDQLIDLCQFADIDADGKPEVLLFLPSKDANSYTARLFVYNDRGDTLFSRFCGVCQQYPTDSLPESRSDFYECGRVRVAEANGRKLIITEIMKNEPGRGYIRLWSTRGDSLGWYINSGGTTFMQVADADHDGSEELLFFGFNNRLQCVALFVLPSNSAAGVGPPYDVNSRGYDLSQVVHGNHKVYLAFPPTDVWQAIGRMDYQGGMSVEVKADEIIAAPNEALDDRGSPIHARYHISPSLSVLGVSLDDSFSTLRRRMIAAGQVKDVPESTYCRILQERVLQFRP